MKKILTILIIFIFTTSSFSASDKKIILNFKDAPISDVAAFMSKITGKNIIVSEDVKGNLNLVSSKPVSVNEAWDIFTLALALNNLTVISDKDYVKIVPADKNIPVGRFSKAQTSGEMELYIYYPENITATDLLNTIRPFLSQVAKTSINGQSNALLIYDYKGNIDKVKSIIKSLDSKERAGDIYVYKLKYAQAEELYKALTPLMQMIQKTNPQFTMAADKSSNSIVIFASESVYNTIKDMLDNLDSERVITEGRSFYIIPLKFTTVMEISRSLSQLLTGSTVPINEPSLQHIQQNQLQTNPNQPFTGQIGQDRSSQFNQPFGQTNQPISTQSTMPTTQTSISAQVLPSITTKEGIKVGFDVGTNSVIVYANKNEYEGIKKLIEILDVRRKQVLITTSIVEVSAKKLFELGVNWQALGTQGGAAFRGLTQDGIYQAFSSGNFLMGVFTNSGKTVSIGDTNVFLPDLALLFSLLESGSGFNIISNPKVLTLDNQLAEIKVGNVIPFASGVRFDINGQPIITYDYREVGLNLKAIPKISSENTLRLSINLILQEVTDYIRPSVGNLSYAVPVTSNRSLNSDVVVENGQVIVIGGLVSNKTIKTMNGVPGLKDIPIVGNLFKYQSESDDKTTLFIFLTPYIISSPEELTKITEEHRKLSEEINKMLKGEKVNK
jgi:general secretion pathway protein D